MIDTLEIADELSRDGVFSREQPERLARISARTAAEALITKIEFEAGLAAIRSDIASFRVEVASGMQALRRELETNTTLLRHEFEAKLQGAKKEQIKLFSGIMLAHGLTVIGVTGALVRLL